MCANVFKDPDRKSDRQICFEVPMLQCRSKDATTTMASATPMADPKLTEEPKKSFKAPGPPERARLVCVKGGGEGLGFRV